MLRKVLISKLHRAVVTNSNLKYEGSITIDEKLIKLAGILPNEEVLVADIDNGNRFNTYVIPGKKGEICLNGAAARLVSIGDRIIIMAFGWMEEEKARNWKPKIVRLNERNEPIK